MLKKIKIQDFDFDSNKGCVTLWPCKKKYLKAKEKLWELKYFTMQKYNLQKNCLK